MRLGLVAYSFKAAWCDAYTLMDRAAAAGLRGVEFPAEQCLPEATADELARARSFAEAYRLGIVADGGVVEEEPLRRWIPQAAALGAPVLRVILSRVLGGNRREMRGGWRAHLERACAVLQTVRPVAEAYGVTVAVENHQDATSEELLWLCDTVGGDRIGITLDTGSTLAVAEGPVEFAQRVMPLVRNIHLKDYHISLSPTGYRLCTCAIGDGVVDFPGLFALFANQPGLPMSIELGARQARHVELLQDDWWAEYPQRPVARLVEALRVLLPRARPTEGDYRIPHERGAPEEMLRAYELAEFDRSVAYLKHVAGDSGATAGRADR
jgi:sugar phosphate isomerase/epimerase